MSRFNTQTVKRVPRAHDTVNRAGAAAYKQSDKMALVSILLNSFVQDQFYRSANQGIKETRALVRKVDPEFAAKAAVFARNEFGMRSISHIVAAEIPQIVKGEKWTKNFIDKVVRRPDDATEIFSLYLSTYGKPVPNSLKKGLALALSKFDEYQLAKYRGEGKGVSLVDLVNLVHPKPSEKNAYALAKLVDGELKSTGTWESAVSAAGTSENKTVAKAEAWGELIESGKIGYMAALKNIRNVVQSAPESLDALLAIISNEHKVKNSLVLPFRYITALDAVEAAGFDQRTKQKIIRALNQALDASFANVPVFDGETLVAIDKSSSMTSNYFSRSQKGGLTRPTIEYAVVLATALLKKNSADLVMYDSKAYYVEGINQDDSFTTILKGIRSLCNGGATNVGSVFETANRKYDRVVILSDNESWSGGYYGRRHNPIGARQDYNRRHSANPFVFAMDLAGYGDLTFHESDSKVANVQGFSEKVFDMMKLLEQDRSALIKKIEAIQL